MSENSPFYYGATEALERTAQINDELNKNRKHRAELLQSENNHHSEMMEMIQKFNQLRAAYDVLELDRDICVAERDIAYDVIRKNQDKLIISKDEINKEIRAARARIKSSRKQSA